MPPSQGQAPCLLWAGRVKSQTSRQMHSQRGLERTDTAGPQHRWGGGQAHWPLYKSERWQRSWAGVTAVVHRASAGTLPGKALEDEGGGEQVKEAGCWRRGGAENQPHVWSLPKPGRATRASEPQMGRTRTRGTVTLLRPQSSYKGRSPRAFIAPANPRHSFLLYIWKESDRHHK